LLLNVGAGIALLIVSGTDHLAMLMVPLWFCVASIGFIGANASAIAMSNSGKLAGSGSALIGMIQFGSAFFVSSMVAACQDGTPRPMVLGMLASGVGACLLWFFFSRSARQPRVEAG
jgi:DHA1 family bicyclomycin/chloramphenicol resistance-like MFS transporter